MTLEQHVECRLGPFVMALDKSLQELTIRQPNRRPGTEQPVDRSEI